MEQDEAERLREVIDMIVERCAEDGKLVTVHKHYRPASDGVAYGFFLTLGVCAGLSLSLLLGKVFSFLWGLIV